jgi:pimeloyl-ACP methyl ester carboxylesterase
MIERGILAHTECTEWAPTVDGKCRHRTHVFDMNEVGKKTRERPQYIHVHEFEPLDRDGMNPVPAVVVGGWNASAKYYFGLARMIARGGSPSEVDESEPQKATQLAASRRVFLIDSPHGTDVVHKALTEQGAPPSIQKRAATMAMAFQKLHIQEADVVAHSQGAYYAALFACAYPKRVRSLLTVAPAGISTALEPRYREYFSDSFAHAAAVQKMLLASTRHIQSHTRKMLAVMRRYFPGDMEKKKQGRTAAQQPELPPLHMADAAALFSIQDLARADIRPALQQLKSAGKSVGVIYMDDDELFGDERMELALKDAKIDLVQKHSGTHTALFDDKDLGKKIVQGLSLLEQNRAD